MNPYFEKLKAAIEANPPNLGDGNSVLTLLYETYSELNRLDNEAIRADLHELYELMNGISGRWRRKRSAELLLVIADLL